MSGRSYQIPSFRRLLRLVSAAFVLCFASVNAAVAATSLSGNLTDPDGGVVPGATVRLLRRADSSRNETQTDGQGQFFFANLDAGEYRLTAEFPGFAPITRTMRRMTSGPRGSNFPTSLY